MNIAILELILQFRNKKVLVLGDFILDIFIHGESTRISPEAPVPVVDIHKTVYCIGGAGNVAANLSALGASVFLCSVIGPNRYEEVIKPLLEQHQLNAKYLVRDDEWETEIKTRIVANDQTLIRFDQANQHALAVAAEDLLIDLLVEAHQQADAILIADYEKGVITDRIVEILIALQDRSPKFLAIDSKRLSLYRKLRPDFVKPNYSQALRLIEQVRETDRISQIIRHAPQIISQSRAVLTAVTLDADGAIWLEEGSEIVHRPVVCTNRTEVCGAGDTYIAAATLALVSGADKSTAAEIASLAAACVVEKPDTAICHIADILGKVRFETKVLTSRDFLTIVIQQLKESGKRIVFTNGCFDILHRGHAHYLEKAKELGDVLIVGINTDESIKRLKGDSRPINLLQDRMDVLAGLSAIDYIISFGNEEDLDNPSALIRLIRPDIIVKGEDYKEKELPELTAIKDIGSQLIFLPFTYGKSTTNIIRRIEKSATDQNIKKLKAL